MGSDGSDGFDGYIIHLSRKSFVTPLGLMVVIRFFRKMRWQGIPDLVFLELETYSMKQVATSTRH